MVITLNHLDLFAWTNLIINLLQIYLLLRILHPRWSFPRRSKRTRIERSDPLR